MDKIASSRELLGELQRIQGLAQAPNPSRVHIAGELQALAERLVVAMKVEWTEKGGKWLARAQYAGGEKHEWTVTESGDVTVKTPEGTFKKKNDMGTLESAQRYAAKFISQANGHEKLADALGKDFTKA
jgi:hypothetical protein